MINLTKKQRYIASVLSGLLMILSFPEIGNLSMFMFIALIPLLLVEHTIYSNKLKSSKLFAYSYLTFFIYNLGTTWWIWNASEGGAILAFVLNSLLMAGVFQMYHITKKKVGKYEGYAAFIIYWVAFEYAHYQWELSWPWLNFGNVFANNVYLIQWYSITGVLGGTLWILLVNFIGFILCLHIFGLKKTIQSQLKLIALFCLLLFVPMAVSLVQYYNSEDVGTNTNVVLAQPNIDPYNEKFTGSVNDQLDKICDLIDKKANDETDFVLAPETALPFTFYEDEVERIIYFHYLVERKAKWNNASLLIGASTKKFFKYKKSRASKKLLDGPGYEEYYNSSMLIDYHDKPRFVHKSKLVLGVEKVPFSHVFPSLEQLSIDNGGASGTLGIEDYAQVLKSKHIKFAPVVCYESIYGSFIAEQCKKGAELIFIITNDGWWGNTPGYKQHLAFARLRAIENRKSVARSANTGISAFINQRGDILSKTEYWKEASITAVMKRNRTKTFYAENGDLIGRSLGLGALIFLVITLSKYFKKLIYRNKID
ncbi:MAG: apolipoprotein N-acyltransferase [Crocinitomicaceae bacterium]|nr:apolipoprotein N-acyltransferase [Crocinitomicaceae bacterium]